VLIGIGVHFLIGLLTASDEKVTTMVEFRCGKMKIDANGTTVRADPRKVSAKCLWETQQSPGAMANQEAAHRESYQ
jgi:hypothetical protein